MKKRFFGAYTIMTDTLEAILSFFVGGFGGVQPQATSKNVANNKEK